MNNEKYLANLTIKELYALAAGDLDDQQLAARIVKHATMAVAQAAGTLPASEQFYLREMGRLIGNELARLDQSKHEFIVWVRQGGEDGTASYVEVRAVNADEARAIVAAQMPDDVVIERVVKSTLGVEVSDEEIASFYGQR